MAEETEEEKLRPETEETEEESEEAGKEGTVPGREEREEEVLREQEKLVGPGALGGKVAGARGEGGAWQFLFGRFLSEVPLENGALLLPLCKFSRDLRGTVRVIVQRGRQERVDEKGEASKENRRLG